MPSILLNCPNCRQPYQMSPEQITKYSGRTITCRKCKQPFAFDAAMDAAAQAAGQAEPEEEAPVAAAAGASEGTDAGTEEGHGDQGAYAIGAGYTPAVAAAAPPLPPRRPAPPPQSAPSYVPQSAPPPVQPAYAPQAFAPAPAAAVGYSPPAHPGSSSGGIGDLFGFQRMALPAMLPVVFWAGIAWCIYNGLRLVLGLLLVTGFHNGPRGSLGWTTTPYTRLSFDGLFDRLTSVAGLYTVVDALFWLILGPLFWRGFCDLILAASRLLAASERK